MVNESFGFSRFYCLTDRKARGLLRWGAARLGSRVARQRVVGLVSGLGVLIRLQSPLRENILQTLLFKLVMLVATDLQRYQTGQAEMSFK